MLASCWTVEAMAAIYRGLTGAAHNGCKLTRLDRCGDYCELYCCGGDGCELQQLDRCGDYCELYHPPLRPAMAATVRATLKRKYLSDRLGKIYLLFEKFKLLNSNQLIRRISSRALNLTDSFLF
jgi:hypothetical protein